jgi:hypothetical protein
MAIAATPRYKHFCIFMLFSSTLEFEVLGFRGSIRHLDRRPRPNDYLFILQHNAQLRVFLQKLRRVEGSYFLVRRRFEAFRLIPVRVETAGQLTQLYR